MSDVEITFEELIEVYYEDAIEMDEDPLKHDMSTVTFIFLHENGNHYRGWCVSSYNNGIEEDYGWGYEEVVPKEVTTIKWITKPKS